jgi:cytochrome c biogenesis protein CcmG/thiol:disulfide interchange protein DsbE
MRDNRPANPGPDARYHKNVKRLSILITAALLVLAGCYSGTRPPRVGEAAPDFAIKDTDRAVALHDLKGQVVVLNFWATWCGPCIEEMPSLVAMQRQLNDKGVKVLAVSIDVDQKAYEKFLKDHGVDLLTVRDPDQKASTMYGSFKWPETYIIDRKGVVRRKFIGAVDWTHPEIQSYIAGL